MVSPFEVAEDRNAPVTIDDHRGVSVSNASLADLKTFRPYQSGRFLARSAYFIAYELKTFM
jgi:hypothetical protein